MKSSKKMLLTYSLVSGLAFSTSVSAAEVVSSTKYPFLLSKFEKTHGSETCQLWSDAHEISLCQNRLSMIDKKRVSFPKYVLKKHEQSVTFDSDSAKLDGFSKDRLDNLVSKIDDIDGDKSVIISGFADITGTEVHNDNLSSERAKVVYNYLSENTDLDRKYVSISGLGETNSITSCDFSKNIEEKIKCLRPDRRVEVMINYVDQI